MIFLLDVKSMSLNLNGHLFKCTLNVPFFDLRIYEYRRKEDAGEGMNFSFGKEGILKFIMQNRFRKI